MKSGIRKIVKIYKKFIVYNEKLQEIGTFKYLKDIAKRFDITNKPILTKGLQTGEGFYPNKYSKRKIFVKYSEEKVETEHIIYKKFIGKNVPNLPGEEWKRVPGFDDVNWCSNLGRFKVVDLDGKSEQLLTGHDSANHNGRLYRSINLFKSDGTRYKAARCSRLLAKAWIDNSLPVYDKKGTKLVVDHKNNNPSDDKVENLQIISQKENLAKASNVGKPLKKAWALNQTTGEYKEFKSTADLGEFITGSRNPGYFNKATRVCSKFPELRGWWVGFITDVPAKDQIKNFKPVSKLATKEGYWAKKGSEKHTFKKATELLRFCYGLEKKAPVDTDRVKMALMNVDKLPKINGWRIGLVKPRGRTSKLTNCGIILTDTENPMAKPETLSYVAICKRFGILENSLRNCLRKGSLLLGRYALKLED